MNAKKKLEQIKAEQELLLLGYHEVECRTCAGFGRIQGVGTILRDCNTCGGDGKNWEKKEEKP